VADADIVLPFCDGTTCCSLVHELGCEQPKTTKELLNITTRHASGEEVVGTTFTLVSTDTATGGGRATPTSTTTRSTKKGAKGRKKGQNLQLREVQKAAVSANQALHWTSLMVVALTRLSVSSGDEDGDSTTARGGTPSTPPSIGPCARATEPGRAPCSSHNALSHAAASSRRATWWAWPSTGLRTRSQTSKLVASRRKHHSAHS
jgi:hypothetical protein